MSLALKIGNEKAWARLLQSNLLRGDRDGVESHMRLKKAIEPILRKYPPFLRFSSKIYYAFDSSFKTLSPGALEAITQAFEKAKQLNPDSMGDYYEFGLFRGYTFWHAQRTCQELGIEDTNFYGFDSFQGLPFIEGVDQANNQFFEGQFRSSKAEVVKNLDKHGIDWSRTVLIEGFFDESLSEDLKQDYAFNKVAVALIDCDLYSSTKDVLVWLTDFLTDNSILLFDDWYSFGDNPELGQQKAFSEFLDLNPEFSTENLMEFEHHGKGFILRKS